MSIDRTESADLEFEFEIDNGCMPSIAQYSEDLEYLNEPGRVMDHSCAIWVEYSYPLKSPVIFTEATPDGSSFTVGKFYEAVCRRYAQIYAEEQESMTVNPEPTDADVLLNRKTSNGKYGIWGHHIGDLALASAEKNADGIWELCICS